MHERSGTRPLGEGWGPALPSPSTSKLQRPARGSPAPPAAQGAQPRGSRQSPVRAGPLCPWSIPRVQPPTRSSPRARRRGSRCCARQCPVGCSRDLCQQPDAHSSPSPVQKVLRAAELPAADSSTALIRVYPAVPQGCLSAVCRGRCSQKLEMIPSSKGHPVPFLSAAWRQQLPLNTLLCVRADSQVRLRSCS